MNFLITDGSWEILFRHRVGRDSNLAGKPALYIKALIIFWGNIWCLFLRSYEIVSEGGMRKHSDETKDPYAAMTYG